MWEYYFFNWHLFVHMEQVLVKISLFLYIKKPWFSFNSVQYVLFSDSYILKSDNHHINQTVNQILNINSYISFSVAVLSSVIPSFLQTCVFPGPFGVLPGVLNVNGQASVSFDM